MLGINNAQKRKKTSLVAFNNSPRIKPDYL